MKKIITISLLTVALFNIANANDKFADLSADYLNTIESSPFSIVFYFISINFPLINIHTNIDVVLIL